MRQPFAILLLFVLAGCGVVYKSASIREGEVDGAKVRIIDVTPETTLAANRQAFSPRTLPAAFNTTAGTYGSGLGAGPLPDPAYEAQQRPAVAQTRLPAAADVGPYRIGVGDVVLLATKSADNSTAELTGLLAAENRRKGYTVQDDGSISIPDVGRVRIGDMTLEEAEAVVFQRLVAVQIDPAFSLEVAEFNARKVSIGGAVVRPGIVPISLTPLTLDGALASVGGVQTADRASALIRIYRRGALYQIPVEAFLTDAANQKIRLIDGDSVFVDTEYDLQKAEAYFEQQIRLSEFRQNSRSAAIVALTQEVALRRGELDQERTNFATRVELDAEDRDYVYLTGELVRPGRWVMPFGQTASVADALYESGGPSVKTGNPSQIYILRGSPDPRDFAGLTAWHLDATTATGLLLTTRFELRPNDVIFVAEQPVTRWSRVIDQISPSLFAGPINQAASN